MDLTGDLSGIRTSQLEELRLITELRTNRGELINPTFAEGLSRLSSIWNREIAVFLNRGGRVVATAVGTHAAANLPPVKRREAPQLRCVHTHPNGIPQLSAVDLSALTELGLESIAAIGVRDGKIQGIQLAHREKSGQPALCDLMPQDLMTFNYHELVAQRPRSITLNAQDLASERAFLVGVGNRVEDVRESLAELKELALTAGVQVIGQRFQLLKEMNSRSYLGSGKLAELKSALQNTGANVLIADDELSPAQQRTLEQATGVKVLDRTSLILDIFARRARSREGKLQVELAQLKHLLPHLTGKGQALSRLGGGVGTRGPGESKLELDRRRVRLRITALESDLAQVHREREVQRRQRLKSGLPLIALVGYTNAGKTTFIYRAMRHTGAPAPPQGENKLFATLDPIVRHLRFQNGNELLLSDTVGFIQKLPHRLLKAFMATLEEVQNADVLIHVLDASHPRALAQAQTVLEVLDDLGCRDKPLVTVLNKVDKVENMADVRRLAQQMAHPVALSLLQDYSLAPVWEHVFRLLEASNRK